MAGPLAIEWSADALADIDRFAAFLHERFPDLAARVGREIIVRRDTCEAPEAGAIDGRP